MSDFDYRTRCEHVVDIIRDRILDGTLSPGSKLVESNLAAEFGISRGPIREALRTLEAEHLVEYTRNVGCVVRTVLLTDIYEAYYLRANYEMMAIRQAEGHFTEEELAFLQLLVLSVPQQEAFRKDVLELDYEFHRVIICKSNLPLLKANWEGTSYGNFMAASNSDLMPTDKVDEIRSAHRELLEILKQENVEASCKAVFDHYMAPLEHEFEKSGLDKTGYCFRLC